MKNKLAVAAVLVLAAIGIYYTAKNARHPADDPALSSLVDTKFVVKSICVEPIQNLSHKAVAMDGIDDELVTQLHKAGFESRKISDSGAQCDAVTNAEVVDVSGRIRKTARVDFRLTLTSEQIPRMSSSVEGKSGGTAAGPLDDVTLKPDSKESAGAEREAIAAALEKTAAQIDAANKRGLPPWQAKQQ